jgi:hypothetical protein
MTFSLRRRDIGVSIRKHHHVDLRILYSEKSYVQQVMNAGEQVDIDLYARCTHEWRRPGRFIAMDHEIGNNGP